MKLKLCIVSIKNIVLINKNYMLNYKMFSQVKKSHDFGNFPVGTTQVTYTATDLAGNNASCVINITVKGQIIIKTK